MIARLLPALFCCAALAGAAPASAQSYPEHPLKLVVPFAPGGGTDILGRIFAEGLSKSLGQTVVVENRGGAGTIIGTQAVAKAPADGYTLLVNGSTMAFLPALFKKLPFDVAEDLRAVTLISEQPYVLVVTPSLPVHSLAEFVKLANAQPDTLTYVSAGIGSATHLASALLWKELGIKLVHVPYKGTAPAVADLMAGNVKVMYTTVAAATELIKSGKVRPLAVSSKTRVDTLPQVPTVAESGKPGFSQASTMTIFVPSATPQPVVDKLFAAATRAVQSQEVRRQFAAQGLMAARSDSPAQADQAQRAEIARWTGIIRESGIKPE